MAVDDRPLALILRTSLLPLSETFIRSQVQALKRWRPRVIGLRYVDGLDLTKLDCELLTSGPDLLRAALREMNLPPPGVRERLQRLNAAIAHVHFGTDLVALWPMLNRLQIPILTTLHGYDINVHPDVWRRSWRASRKYPQRLLEISRDERVRFIAVSEAIKARAIEFGLPADRVVVRYIGVDTEQFSPGGVPVEQRRPRILFVGRMVEKKNPLIIIKAFAEVRRRVSDAELVMIGDGPLLDSCRALASSMHVSVQFLGAVSHARVKEEMGLARVFCLPSITAESGDAEGLSIAIIEAQAAGVPVVTSARGGEGEAIEHGVTGFGFPEGEVDALAAALIALLTDSQLSASVSAAARERACKLFDLNRCTAQLESFYDQSVAAYTSKPAATAFRSQPQAR